MANILIAGASGFIGGHVAGRLHGNHKVLGIGRAQAPAFPGGWRYRPDIGGPGALAGLIQRFRPDYLIHCAGTGRVDTTFTAPADDFAAGPGFTFALMDALRREAPGCVTIYFSSAAVHGSVRSGLVGPDTALAPISPYGYHKLMCETILTEFRTVYGLDSIILRLLSCYGPGLRKQVLWDICRKASTGTLELFGTGRETRDFLHVDDVSGLAAMLVDRAVRHGVYAVGSGRSVSIAGLAGMLIENLGLDHVPVTFKGDEHQGYPSHWLADVAPLAEIGFTPSVSLEDGVRGYAHWFAGIKGVSSGLAGRARTGADCPACPT